MQLYGSIAISGYLLLVVECLWHRWLSLQIDLSAVYARNFKKGGFKPCGGQRASSHQKIARRTKMPILQGIG
jgi:hypothetical protein